MVYSQDLEKQVIGGLIKFPEIYSEISSFLSEEDFVFDLNKNIYSLIRHSLNNKEPIDPILLLVKIKNIGIPIKDDVNPEDYINALSLVQCNPNSVIQAVKDLKNITARRNFIEVAEKIKKRMIKGGDMSHEEISSYVDKTVYNEMRGWYSASDAVDLFESMEERIEILGNNPVDEIGIPSPYKYYNLNYGGFRNGNVYCFASRPKQGKALEENTLIPTPEGFKKIKDFKPGDLVFAVDGSVTKVSGVAKWTNRKLYKVSCDDGSFVIADEAHEWNCQRFSDGIFENIETKEIAEEDNGVRLPLYEQLKLHEKEFLMDPYVFGIWIGCGSFKYDCFSIVTKKTGVISKYKEFAIKNNLNYSHVIGDVHKITSKDENNNIFKFLNFLRASNKKRIPIDYLRCSIKQRNRLLKGLLVSSGAKPCNGEYNLKIESQELVEDIASLIRTLGRKCSVYSYSSISFKNLTRPTTIWKVSFSAKKLIEEPYEKRHIFASYFGVGNTVCLEIKHPSHIFLCGEGYLPTHNSSFLNSTAFHMSNTSPKRIPTLILDTEMQSEEIQERVLAMISGVPVWYITTGNWRKNPDYVDKIRSAWKTIKSKKYNLFHEYVINTPVDQVINKIKKWYYTKVGRGNQCLIVYDYVKITGESLSDFNREHQAIGEKVNLLKELVSKDITAPLLTAVQVNRTGDNRREVRDDSSVIALSDRVLWFASQVSIFRRKNPEEIQTETANFGTHKLINLESRWQGRQAAGHIDYVRDLGGNLINNFTNFTVDNFKVTEHADATTMFNALGGNPDMPQRQQAQNPLA